MQLKDVGSANATTLIVDESNASIAAHATEIALGRRASTWPHEPTGRRTPIPRRS